MDLVEEKEKLKDNKKTDKIVEEKIKNKKRSRYWDIVKAIGIISIVIGHIAVSAKSVSFVYTYNLIIFYFVSGFFYNESKYGDNPSNNFFHRLKRIWPKYIFYSILFIIMHNLLVECGMYTENVKYTFQQMMYQFSNSIILIYPDSFLETFWFLPTLLFAVGIFGTIMFLSRKITDFICRIFKKAKADRDLIKYLILILLSIIIALIGGYLNINHVKLKYHMQVSAIVTPIITMGYFLKININKLKDNKKINNIFVVSVIFILSLLFIWNVVVLRGKTIELSSESIIGFPLFYIIELVGIIFCITLGRIIDKIPIINNIIGCIGKYSFSIMALHVVCIKLIDIIYQNIINETDPNILSIPWGAYTQKLWMVYLVLGTLLPAIFGCILNNLKYTINNYISNKMKTEN